MKIILVSNEDGDPQSLSFTIRDPWGRDPNDFSIVQKAKEYIYSHFTSRIFLPDVAAAVNVSEWYLSKLLNKETGKGFSQIVLEARVDLAKEILLQSKRPVMNDVATAAGFYDAAHFSHDFKKVGNDANRMEKTSTGAMRPTSAKYRRSQHFCGIKNNISMFS